MNSTTVAVKPRLLYVDDEPENLKSFQALFRREYEVTVAASATDALALMNREPFQVLVTDQRMPLITGTELLAHVAAEYPETVRFMLTGFSDFDPLVDAINTGKIQGYFSKPLDPDEFNQRVEKALHTSELERQNLKLLRVLQDNEDFLQTIIENMPDMVFVKDAQDLRFVRFNRAGEALLGFSRQELLGKTEHDFFPAAEAESIAQKERETLASGQILDTPEETVQTRDKGPRVLHTKKIPIFDADGAPRYLLGVSRDITDQLALESREKQLETQLRQLQKMEAIGTLAGGIAHDFNNILSPIIGYTEMALMDLQAGSMVYENIKTALGAAQRARDLVGQILTFSRQSETELKPLMLQPIIKEAFKLLRSSLPSTIEMRLQMDASCGAAMADPTQMHQILMNLCTNAFYAMKEKGGILEVSLSEVHFSPPDLEHFPEIGGGPHLRLSVSDTGSGIPKEYIERVFDPYFTTKAKGEGTGLGLSVVHGIVTRCKGSVKIYSEPGKGTVVHIFLPVNKPTQTAASESPLPAIPTGGEHILVVDDEIALAKMIKQMLDRLGYRVTAFHSSFEALAYYEANAAEVDLVISDLTMPNLTGLQLAHKMTAVHQDARIIICTGFSEQLSAEKIKALGVRGVIMKPVIIRDLAAIVRNVLDEAPV